MGRFIVIVLDGFGIGEMPDVSSVRPQDHGANTFAHIVKAVPSLELPTLSRLGLANASGFETNSILYSKTAVWGRAKLMHDGADTFFGHQEIMGTLPKKPVMEPIKNKLDTINDTLTKNGWNTRVYQGDQERLLIVEECITVADNIECDPGLAFNVTVALDDISFERAVEVARLVREVSTVSRVIVFGGRGVHLPDMLAAIEEYGAYIGVNAPASGVYRNDYHCVHLGYGVNAEVQAPTILGKMGVPVYLLGKVADVVSNAYGTSVSMVDTRAVLKETLALLRKEKSGFFCVNVQETDLSGHQEDAMLFASKLEVADAGIADIVGELSGDDILVVMADHGNDPAIGHPHHTREMVPLMIHSHQGGLLNIGVRETLSDIGATATAYFGAASPENGTSFLDLLARPAFPV